MNTKQKKLLITGGSRGIGAETVRLFASEGYNVSFIYNSSSNEAKELSLKTGAYALKADVSVRKDVKYAVSEAIKLLGGIDVLINNAGISEFKLFNDITEHDWNRMLGINLGSVFHCTQEVLPIMLNNKSGKIINISSIWGMVGASCEVHYSTAKAAVIGMTKALAKELAPSGITVNCIAPGIIDTEMNKSLDRETIEELKNQTPLGRLGTPKEIAQTLLFLSSEKANFITGQIISPNGGFVI